VIKRVRQLLLAQNRDRHLFLRFFETNHKKLQLGDFIMVETYLENKNLHKDYKFPKVDGRLRHSF